MSVYHINGPTCYIQVTVEKIPEVIVLMWITRPKISELFNVNFGFWLAVLQTLQCAVENPNVLLEKFPRWELRHSGVLYGSANIRWGLICVLVERKHKIQGDKNDCCCDNGSFHGQLSSTTSLTMVQVLSPLTPLTSNSHPHKTQASKRRHIENILYSMWFLDFFFVRQTVEWRVSSNKDRFGHVYAI